MVPKDESSLEFYNKLMDKAFRDFTLVFQAVLVLYTDNLTGGWLLIGTPIPVLSILALYLWFVLRMGPRLMASRQPYQMTSIMRLYNVIQVLHNGYMIYGSLNYYGHMWLVVKESCNVSLSSDLYPSEKYIFLIYSWHYLLSKILDLMDTVFLVLRKKNTSLLHIYHHTAMVFCTWLTCSYMKTYQTTLGAVANVYVHFVMYSYFLLATFPQLKPYLWWKKHLTKLQMLQFVVILAYFSLLYYFDCPISLAVTVLWSFNVFAFLLLFINFYIRSYVFPSSNRTPEDKNM